MKEAGIKLDNTDDQPGDCAFDLEENEDPLGNYGYGVLSFFDLIRNLIYFFIFISLLYVPTMMHYTEWNGLQYKSLIQEASLANFGMAETACKQY